MTNAYAKEYLNDAMTNLGEAVDYAVNVCKLDIDKFMDMFITSEISKSFEKGNPKYVSGVSGTELAMEIIKNSGIDMAFKSQGFVYEPSKEYWSGWILAYYQWATGRSFKDINNYIPMSNIRTMYHPLHEAPEEKFVDTVQGIIRRKSLFSKLQNQRKKHGYSQSELAKKSGVNLRTLQQYEAKTKDINKASVQTVLSLSKALGCSVDDIIEYSNENIY